MDQLHDKSAREGLIMREEKIVAPLNISLGFFKPKEIPKFSFYGYKRQIEAGMGISLHSTEKCGKTLLVFGFPGTGKTLFPCAVANKLNATLKEKLSLAYIRFDGSDTVERKNLSGKLGDLLEKMHKNTPAILHIIELDALGRPFEKSSDSGLSNSVDFVPRLLRYTLSRKAVEMKNTLVICTANYPRNMDGSFLHRFNSMFYFEPISKQVVVDAVAELLGRTDSEEVATEFLKYLSELIKLVPLSGNVVKACKLLKQRVPDIKELGTREVVHLLARSLSLSMPVDIVEDYESTYDPFIQMSNQHIKFWQKAYLNKTQQSASKHEH